MAYRVVYKKSVQRDIKHLSKQEASRILDKIEEELSVAPEINPALKGQFAGLRELRVGDYRVVYAILDDQVLILRIGHRRYVYRGSV